MIESKIGYSTNDEIFVRGRSLTRELMGNIDFTDMCLLEITGEMPSREVKETTNAILVMLSDHGLMPSVIASRMTQLGAPEALQGAVAAGILGAGNHFLGTTQNAAEWLQAATGGTTNLAPDRTEMLAAEAVARWRDFREPIAGLGHPLHKNGDPRSTKLFEIAEANGLCLGHCRLLERTQLLLSEERGKFVPLNAAGAVGAVISDIGWKPVMARALSLIARVPGLLAHLLEEIDNPQAEEMWGLVMRNSTAFSLDE
ncbi:MAG: citryl-CoA lyase [Jhaorihella sp.]